jgi:Lon protease-like protein
MMGSMAEVIRVNFGRPVALFPLSGAVLLPHAIQPLHVFEPRYRQLLKHALDGSGQMALASFAGREWQTDYFGSPPLRAAVCVGQVVYHEPMPDGRCNILLQGICRARIVNIMEPEGDRQYRLARLAPIEAVEEEPPPMLTVRDELRDLLAGPRLSKMRSVETVMGWFERDDVSTHALLELIGFVLVKDNELKYRLLAEANADRRAGMIKSELVHLDQLVARAELQSQQTWPKGMSWN